MFRKEKKKEVIKHFSKDEINTFIAHLKNITGELDKEYEVVEKRIDGYYTLFYEEGDLKVSYGKTPFKTQEKTVMEEIITKKEKKNRKIYEPRLEDTKELRRRKVLIQLRKIRFEVSNGEKSVNSEKIEETTIDNNTKKIEKIRNNTEMRMSFLNSQSHKINLKAEIPEVYTNPKKYKSFDIYKSYKLLEKVSNVNKKEVSAYMSYLYDLLDKEQFPQEDLELEGNIKGDKEGRNFLNTVSYFDDEVQGLSRTKNEKEKERKENGLIRKTDQGLLIMTTVREGGVFKYSITMYPETIHFTIGRDKDKRDLVKKLIKSKEVDYYEIPKNEDKIMYAIVKRQNLTPELKRIIDNIEGRIVDDFDGVGERITEKFELKDKETTNKDDGR